MNEELVCIKINPENPYGDITTAEGLYRHSRGVWDANPTRIGRTKHAVIVKTGTREILEVYDCEYWKLYEESDFKNERPGNWDGRMVFTGCPTTDITLRELVGKFVDGKWRNPTRFMTMDYLKLHVCYCRG